MPIAKDNAAGAAAEIGIEAHAVNLIELAKIDGAPSHGHGLQGACGHHAGGLINVPGRKQDYGARTRIDVGPQGDVGVAAVIGPQRDMAAAAGDCAVDGQVPPEIAGGNIPALSGNAVHGQAAGSGMTRPQH